MDCERLENLTAPSGELPRLSSDDAPLREAWLALAQALDAPEGGANIDPDDLYAEIMRRERKRRREFWRNAAVMAASVLFMVAVVAGALWNGGRDLQPPVAKRNSIEPMAVAPWDDDWEANADSLTAQVALVRERLREPSEGAWIDRQIQVLFDECVGVWTTL